MGVDELGTELVAVAAEQALEASKKGRVKAKGRLKLMKRRRAFFRNGHERPNLLDNRNARLEDRVQLVNCNQSNGQY